MDPKQKARSRKNSECENDEDSESENVYESASSSRNDFVIQIPGTHTTATDTDEMEPRIYPNLSRVDTLTFNEADESFAAEKLQNISMLYKKNTSTAESESEKSKSLINNKPVEEMITEMNENIQTIIGMFGPVKTDGPKDEGMPAKPGKRVSFERDKSHKKIRNTPASQHRSRFDQFVEAKKSLITVMPEKKRQERIVPDTEQKDPIPHSSQYGAHTVQNNSTEPSPPSVSEDATLKTRSLEPSTNSNNITNKQGPKNTNETNISNARLPRIDGEDVLIPMYNNRTGRSVSMSPCEDTFHTLHIEAAPSPSSSAMYRPSIGTRLWKVVADFITAVCVCLQMNRDCIFCLGFFVAFVVSASFLTAFFYRTLNIGPQGIQHTQGIQQTQRHQRLTTK